MAGGEHGADQKPARLEERGFGDVCFGSSQGLGDNELMHINRKDLGAAAIFGAIGAFFAIDALSKLNIGTPVQMGPGYFPLVLAGVLLLLTLVIIVRSVTFESTPFGAWPWRGVILILAAPLIFSFTIRGLGLGPTTFIVSMFTSFASVKMKPLFAVLLSLGIAIFCTIVFIWGIGMPIPVFGPWLTELRMP